MIKGLLISFFFFLQQAAFADSTGSMQSMDGTGWMAKAVLATLLILSTFCWGLILYKFFFFKKVKYLNREFFRFFLNEHQEAVLKKAQKFQDSTLAQTYRNGLQEWNLDRNLMRVERALIQSSREALMSLESHLNWLSTTAAVAPFVGLFGTVWGIMDAFERIGQSGSAQLSVVAPGISEALVTTAAGIAVAVPAVIAYHYFLAQLRIFALDLEGFQLNFLNTIGLSQKKS